MADDYQQTERISRYLEGDMAPAERQAFEAELEQDEALQKEVGLQKEAILGVACFVEENYRHAIQAVAGRLKHEGFFLNEENIRDYLRGNLEESLRAPFEERLKNDPAFAEEVRLEKDMLEGINLYAGEEEAQKIQRVRQRLQEDGFFPGQESPPKGKVVSLSRRRLIAIAASLAILLAAGLYLFLPDSGTGTYAGLYEAYYRPETAVLPALLDQLEASGFAQDVEQSRQLADALQRYETGAYAEAASALSTYLEQYPQDREARLFLGLAGLETGQYREAIPELRAAGKAAEPQVAAAANWYLALALLQTGKAEEATALLRQLAAGDTRWSGQARELAGKLSAMD